MSAAFRIPVLALGATLVAATAFAIGLSQPEATIGRSFTTAFEQQPRVPHGASGRSGVGFDPAYLHLTHLQLSSQLAPPAVGPGQAVRLGDRISFASADGATRSYVVVEVRQLLSGATGRQEHADREPAGPRMLLVTANGSDGVDAAAPAVVRFIVEAPADVRAPVPPRPHAL